MTALRAGARISLSSILYLTDFSAPSEAALPFCLSIAREYGASVHALHVLIPSTVAFTTPELAGITIEAQEEAAEAEMRRVDSQLAGVPHDITVKRGFDVWPTLEAAVVDKKADIVVLGTHGRTGAQKLLMGSFAEEIFRRSRVPVLTIGPAVNRGIHGGARFRCILFATDFTPESLAAAPWAISMAQENQARLVLLNVQRQRENSLDERIAEKTVAHAMYTLHELVPPSVELWCRSEVFVKYGDPSREILEIAREQGADLIVLGVRDAYRRLAATTHLSHSTAQSVVAQALCPVLTVRGLRTNRRARKSRNSDSARG